MSNFSNYARVVNACQLAFKLGEVAYGQTLMKQFASLKMVVASEATGANRRSKLEKKAYYYGIDLVILPTEIFNQITNRPILSFGIKSSSISMLIQKERIGEDIARKTATY